MGLFDTFYGKVKCPYCERVVELDFQTKALECLLHEYRRGDVIQSGGHLKIVDAEVDDALAVHDCCNNEHGPCAWITATVVIVDGRFTKVKNVRKDDGI